MSMFAPKPSIELRDKLFRQKNPILLRVEKNAGHNGDAKPTIKQVSIFSPIKICIYTAV